MAPPEGAVAGWLLEESSNVQLVYCSERNKK